MIKFMFIIVIVFFTFDMYTDAAVQCPQPDIPENGHGTIRQMKNMSTGSVVGYQCDVGYILVGVESRTCESNGVWSGSAPVCALNVALYKPAVQSSTLFDDDSQTMRYANLSTDGNFEGSCSSTRDEKISWWQVDLLETYLIYAVEILIPPNPGGKPLQELHIVTSVNDDFSSKNKSVSLCYKHDGSLEINRLHTFICAQESPGRFVRLFTRNASVNLCEVVVLTKSAVSEWQCGTVKDMSTWGGFGGRCFYGSLESMPWFSANTHCEMNGATLAYDLDAGCHQFLISQIKYRSVRHAQSYWLGLSNTGKEWRWINGKPVKTTFWADPAANDVASTNMAYAAAMVLSFQWSWMPSLQALWYFWICQSTPKFCSSPGKPYGGGVTVSSQMYTIGSTASYYCNSGYVAEGETTRTCLENGTWSGTVPKCSAVDCGRPDIFLGASVKYLNESTAFGSLVEYQCPPGQKIAGAQFRTCQVEGKWSDKMPRCEDMDCGHPGEIERGKVFLIENSTKIGNIAEYTCEGGFGLMGAAVRHCSATGSWIPTQAPVCYDITGLHVTPFPNAETGYQSNLITGFIVAVVILLVLIVVVVFWMWKKKKLYDSFSMSTMYATNSQLTATPTINSNSCSHDLLYAFPNSTPTSQPKAPNYYSNSSYNESAIDHANDIGNGTVRVLRASDLYPFNNSAVNETTPNGNNVQSSVFGNRPQLYIAVDRPATAEQLDRVVKNINFTLSQCRRQQNNSRPSIPSVFHTIRKMPTSSSKTNVVDFVRKKLSEVTFVPPPLQERPTISGPIDIGQIQERSSSPTPSELFSFDDDDDEDREGFVEESNPRRNDSQYYFPSSYSNASTQKERTSHYDCLNQNESPSTSTPTPIYAVSSSIVPIRCRTSGDGESTKIYDLPPDAAAKMNDNLAKVLLKQYYSDTVGENVYEVPCSEPSLNDADAIVQDEKVVLGNGVEIVHTYC